MHRSVQVGIALLVLSVRLWGKLFFISEYVGKSDFGQYLTQEIITKAVLIFFISYYILVKVLSQMIFRARMQRAGATLTPHWFPFIGNLVAMAKSHLKNERDGLGRDTLAWMPFNLNLYAQNATQKLPNMVAVNSIVGDGSLLVFNDCESMKQMLIKNAKHVDKSDDIPRIIHGFGGTSFVFQKNSKEQTK